MTENSKALLQPHRSLHARSGIANGTATASQLRYVSHRTTLGMQYLTRSLLLLDPTSGHLPSR